MQIAKSRLDAVAAAIAKQQEEPDAESYVPIAQCALDADAKWQRDQAKAAAAPATADRAPGQPVHGHEMVCVVCGCTDAHGCKGGCYWAKPDLCSACEVKARI